MNAEGIPAARRSPRGWAPSAVREILHRPIYKGEVVYGQLQKVVRGGTRKRRQLTEEMIKVAVEKALVAHRAGQERN